MFLKCCNWANLGLFEAIVAAKHQTKHSVKDSKARKKSPRHSPFPPFLSLSSICTQWPILDILHRCDYSSEHTCWRDKNSFLGQDFQGLLLCIETTEGAFVVSEVPDDRQEHSQASKLGIYAWKKCEKQKKKKKKWLSCQTTAGSSNGLNQVPT